VDGKDQETESLEGADERCVIGHLSLVFLLCLKLLELTDLGEDTEIKVHCCVDSPLNELPNVQNKF
jgi:hypothetical protein